MDLNMDLKRAFGPETRTLAVHVGLGLLLLAAAAYVLVVLSLKEHTRLTNELADIAERTRRQQEFMPAWASMAGLSQNASLGALSVPKAEPVPRTRVYLMPEQISHMAQSVGLESLEVTLNPSSLGQDPSSIQVQGVFSGQLDAVREFLMSVARMPSLARIERVELRAADGRLELFLQLRIALAN